MEASSFSLSSQQYHPGHTPFLSFAFFPAQHVGDVPRRKEVSGTVAMEPCQNFAVENNAVISCTQRVEVTTAGRCFCPTWCRDRMAVGPSTELSSAGSWARLEGPRRLCSRV